MKSKSEKEWIVLVGGGSGGHVVPLKHIAQIILKGDDSSNILIVTDRKYSNRTLSILKDLKKEFGERLVVKPIYGGKFRRYGRNKFREITDIKTQVLNFIDLFKSGLGFLQSKFILIKFRPSVIFCKGGTGALEFCFAARKKAPTIVHDSDSRPGMANKTVSRWAEIVLTGMPRDAKQKDLETMVGVPVSKEFKPAKGDDKKNARVKLGIDQKADTVLVTGGSLGAKKINDLVFCTIDSLNKLNIQVLHQTGSASETEKANQLRKGLLKPSYYKPFDFSSSLPMMFAAADIVAGRAGASAIQELANSAKPAILIPAGLTDQKKNAKIMEELGVALVADQDDLLANPQKFISEIQYLLGSDNLREDFSEEIFKLAKPESVENIAEKILKLRAR